MGFDTFKKQFLMYSFQGGAPGMFDLMAHLPKKLNTFEELIKASDIFLIGFSNLKGKYYWFIFYCWFSLKIYVQIIRIILAVQKECWIKLLKLRKPTCIGWSDTLFP